MTRELLSIDEFCIAANVGKTKAYELFNSNELNVVKLGRKTLVPRAELQRWIANLTPYNTKNNEEV